MLSPLCGTKAHKTKNCMDCRKKARMFCYLYHLEGQPFWSEFVSESEWLIPLLARYSSYEFEYFFRKIYQFVYRLECDRAHANWNFYLACSSLVFDNVSGPRYFDNLASKTYNSKRLHDEDLELKNVQIGGNYWHTLIFRIFLKSCDRSDLKVLDYLDLHNKLGPEIKNQKNILFQLGIEIDNTKVRALYGDRGYTFGYTYREDRVRERLSTEEETW
ncbi:unnamed protein product [Macrosiphum euphorbiae]|uniref:LAGLIDADG homing endonuclease n=1 Tax=Macrosiphum euphorbiae TaxID=13131 RepID=A0AAV0Y959_9HEMI|nr:unnamed protein product [Macrosiphum euphorbiae]